MKTKVAHGYPTVEEVMAERERSRKNWGRAHALGALFCVAVSAASVSHISFSDSPNNTQDTQRLTPAHNLSLGVLANGAFFWAAFFCARSRKNYGNTPIFRVAQK
jgi:hypothetical protein